MRKILLAASLAFAAAAGCSKSDSAEADKGAKAEANLPAMTIDEVDRALAAKEITPADCNHDKTRKSKGVLPGAILISDAESYPASELPADKATKLVFYCADPG